jgi:hypothetical protein
VRRYRLLGILAALAVCTVIEAAPAEYEASVQQGYATERQVQHIGIAPFSCPRELECGELEERLVERLTQGTGVRVIPSKAVAELMGRANVTALGERESRLIIAEGLGVDAFAFVHIQKAQIDRVAPREDDKWKELKRDISVKSVALELRVAAPDGVSVVQVSGEAHVPDSLRGFTSIATRLLDLMLEKAWR